MLTSMRMIGGNVMRVLTNVIPSETYGPASDRTRDRISLL